MSLRTSSLAAALVLVVSGCRQEPFLSVNVSKRAMDGRTERSIVSVQAADGAGQPGKGTVRFTVSAGSFIEGNELALAEGAATATFTCDPRVDTACNGEIPIGVEWFGQSATAVVKVGATSTAPSLRWRVTLTGVSAALNDVAVAHDGAAWAVGNDGAVMRFTGWWSGVPSGTSNALNAVFAMGAKVYVFGNGGTALSWSGTAFQPVTSSVSDDFTAAWGDGPTNVFVTSAQGRVFHFDGQAFTLAWDSGGGARLSCVHGAGSDVWVAGEGVVGHLSGGAWEQVATPVLGRWHAVWAATDGAWLAGERADPIAGARGLVLQGPQWKVSSFERPVLDFTAFDTQRVALTDTDVLRRVGDEPFVSLDAPLGGIAIGGASASDLVVVGAQGLVVRGTP